MATQAQYDAATKAIQQLADHKIASLPIFEQGLARQGITDELVKEFAKVAVDAVVK